MGNAISTLAVSPAPPRATSTRPTVSEPDLARRAAGGCVASRNLLVQRHLPFVIHVAREYRGLGLPLEDLVHEGALGLCEAAARFEPDRGHRFLTFATWWVRKSLRAALRNGAGVVAVPGYQRRRLREIRDAENDLRARLGRRPDEGELADHLGRSVARVRRTLRRQRHELRLDTPAGGDGDTTWAELLRDRGDGGPESDLLRSEIRERLVEELDRLEPRERQVLRWRFGLDDHPTRTLQEISEAVGLSRERVRQIEVEAKRRLRRRLARCRLAPVD